MTSSFSYKWIPYNSIIEKTGICMKFKYKMTGDNNTLSLSFQTWSGYTTLVWRLHGNHGNLWKSGYTCHQPQESFAVINLFCCSSFFVFLIVAIYLLICIVYWVWIFTRQLSVTRTVRFLFVFPNVEIYLLICIVCLLRINSYSQLPINRTLANSNFPLACFSSRVLGQFTSDNSNQNQYLTNSSGVT